MARAGCIVNVAALRMCGGWGSFSIKSRLYSEGRRRRRRINTHTLLHQNQNEVVFFKTLVGLKSHPPIAAVRPRAFCIKPTMDLNPAGSIDSPLMQSMENKIKEDLKAETVVVKDAYGDGRHVSIDVISSAFEGQSAVNRQRMVYKAIWEELENIVHAVDQMTTRTPAEAATERSNK